MFALELLFVALLVLDALALILFIVFFAFWFYYTHLYAVPFVPSQTKIIEEMLSHIDDLENATILDLGSGTGKILIAASRRGARTIGIEINPLLVLLTKLRIHMADLSSKAAVIRGDFCEMPLPRADAVMMYLLPEVNASLRSKLVSEMPPDTLIVSNSFPIEGWTATHSSQYVKVYRVPSGHTIE